MEINKTSYFPWALIQQWPANGITRKLEKWGIEATHFPRTSISKEKIVIKKGRYSYKSIKLDGKWTLPKLIKN